MKTVGSRRAHACGCGWEAFDEHSPTTEDWPSRHDLFGVRVSSATYESSVEAILTRARAGGSGLVECLAVHPLIESVRNAAFRKVLNDFSIVAPDGQPVRWALNRFHRQGLTDRVYGPELMQRLCLAADRDTPIYLYGSTPEVIERLMTKLPQWSSRLVMAGAESPPFRALTAEEDAALIERISASGARIVFIGLGCPRQETFAWEHRESIRAVQVCVGAAFDFHAGTKRMAPAWMQRRGLEWLFRMLSEPRRLWRRYAVTNTYFIFLVLRQMLRGGAPEARSAA